MKAYLVALLLVGEVFLVSAHAKDDLGLTKVKKLEDLESTDIDIPSDGKSTEAQKRGDPGYYHSRPNRFQPSHGFGRHNYRGRIVTRLQSQTNRPFNQYGPPDQGNQATGNDYYRPASVHNIVHQETPEPVRQSEFAEESPIASQNNQPFGQHTANYLPPRNQKLPAANPPHLFSNQNHDFPQQQVQQQQFEQLQIQQNSQNFDNQDFNNFGQNQFTNQQISDAAQFLTQNAQAISNLYGAPAPNQNYAPTTEGFEQVDQQLQSGQQSENLQISSGSQSQGFTGQLPSYASGVLNAQDAFDRVQSIEKDRIIAQLQQTLSERENSGRNVHNFNSNTFQHGEFSPISQQLQVQTGTSSFNNQQSSNFLSLSQVSSENYQGYYEPSAPSTTPQAPVSSTLSAGTSASLQVAPGNTHISTSLPAQNNLRPAIANPGFSQYGGFVPTFLTPGGFVPTYGTTFLSAAPVKPAESAPTHFAIPIPTFQGQKPTHPANTTPVTVNPVRPSRPTISIPLGPVNSFVTPVQTPVIKPGVPVGTPVFKPVVPVGTPVFKPVVPVGTPVFKPGVPVTPSVIKPVIPAATPIHPTYGIHPAAINPAFVYRPVKVYPVYYYPNGAYQSSHKSLVPAASSHPWSYAPSFTQGKPAHIWK